MPIPSETFILSQSNIYMLISMLIKINLNGIISSTNLYKHSDKDTGAKYFLFSLKADLITITNLYILKDFPEGKPSFELNLFFVHSSS